jgi:hypothetical protein
VTTSALPLYEPPTGDEPLDDIEQALVRALVPILVRKVREAAAQKDAPQPVAETNGRAR